MIVNTSFNVRGEPIVGTPEDAYRCFMRTDMDVLVLENFVLEKTEQTPVARTNRGGRSSCSTDPHDRGSGRSVATPRYMSTPLIDSARWRAIWPTSLAGAGRRAAGG